MKERLDVLLVERGLAPSRERARALILAGAITVDGSAMVKAGGLVDLAAQVAVRTPDHPWVGRGGIKLAHALEVFGIDPAGGMALDIGASTGGFTDVLLQRGARRVVALDVGHNQLDWRLRNDPRVVAIEGANARHLRPDDLPPDARAFDLIVVDVSFISLQHILPPLPPLLAPNGRVIVLVKPQFEAGRREVGRGGVIRSAAVHARVVDEIARAARAVGLERTGLEPSPIAGAKGNREFFMLLTPGAPAGS